ncbi:hypothetical protein ACH5RR_007034 [Cinchona calisaya]|uniref:Uncharacterized protein n=1 Tax=Cinchona calisaya TaxID=153742 RepID=A0ABD3AQN3_9GENT
MACLFIKEQMGLWRKLACLSLLLLMLFQLATIKCYAEDQQGEFSSFRVGYVPSPSHKDFKRNADKEDGSPPDNEIFGADKRKVYTGPNPLHNR